MAGIRLIVGLGNPGRSYADTPHNVGARWVEQLAGRLACPLAAKVRFKGRAGRSEAFGQDVRLLLPTTWMNLSGESVAPFARFYGIEPEEILIAHDEVDFPAGVSRLKVGGRHDSHNGIASVASALGNRSEFARLRIGVGHPGKERMVSYLLGARLPATEREAVAASLKMDDELLGLIVRGEWQKAMTRLHSRRADGAG